jgi:hypothetical protein
MLLLHFFGEAAMAAKFILSIDGGGIRGIIPAAILVELQNRLVARGKNEPLCRYFDMIAGTSTGAIIAAGLSCPHPHNPLQPAATPADLVALYRDRGEEIFSRKSILKLLNFRGLFDEQYDAEPLEAIIKSIVGDGARISDSLTIFLATAYEIESRQAVFMTNADDANSDYLFWQALRGTSAAPTYFQTARVENRRSGDNGLPGMLSLIDGGVFANDPAMAAYVEARKKGWADSDIQILSIGTGLQLDKIAYADAKNWGVLGWIDPSHNSPILSILMDGQATTTGYQVNKIMNSDPQNHISAPPLVDGSTQLPATNRDKVKYFRLNGPLKGTGWVTGIDSELDKADTANIKRLQKLAGQIVARNSDVLDIVADRLQPRS